MLTTFPTSGLSWARRRRVSGDSWLVCICRKLPRAAALSHGGTGGVDTGRMRAMRALTVRQRVLLAGVTVLTVAAGVMHYSDVSPTATFFVAALALAGLAWIVAFATEEVGYRFGPAVTGFLQSTLGNL